MNVLGKIIICCAITITFKVTTAYSQDISPTAAPAWIVEREVNYDAEDTDNRNNGSVSYLLDDQQSYTDGSGLTFYVRQIFKLNTLQAIEQMGTLGLQYNPAYQDYVIHHVNVIRDGEVIDMLPNIRLTVDSFNSEINTDDHEGQNVVQMYIADLRRGDTIDYSVSIVGQNPAFGNETVGMILNVAIMEINNVYRRITVPADVTLNINVAAGLGEPAMTVENNQRVYEWYWDKLEQSTSENAVPVWHPQYPYAYYSSFANWNEIANWAYQLFEIDVDDVDLIQETALELTQNSETEVDKLKAIFSFMQSEIRYTGLEIGRNGYRPFPATEVLRRRYGDCKDQTVLLIALLRAIGIEASGALVNSISGKLIPQYGETPLAFNHVIVRATLSDETYWLDPTISIAQDKAADLTPPRYMYALVIDENAQQLSEIPLEEQDPYSPHIAVLDNYSIKDGVFGELTWQRTTRFSGATADFIRNSVDYIGERQLGINLRTSHQFIHEGIENREFTTINDTEDFVELHEDYVVPKAGVYDENRNLTIFSYAPRNIAELLVSPANISDRKSPLALQFPARRRSIANFYVPGAAFNHFQKQIRNEFFTFKFRGWYEGNIFKMIYEFETHKDHVPVEKLQKYKEDIDLLLSSMIFYVASNGNRPTSRMEVYQPVLNQTARLVDTNNMDVHEKIETFINTGGLNYLRDSREEALEILNDPNLPIDASDDFFNTLIGYSLDGNDYHEAFFYHDLHVKTDGVIDFDLLMYLIRDLVRNSEYEMAEDVLLKEIEDHSQPINSNSAGYLQNLLRELYWIQKDFTKLRSVLEHIVEHFPDREQFYRELKVVYKKLSLDNELSTHSNLMNSLGISDPEIVAIEEGYEHHRRPRILVPISPIYPKTAERSGTEGYAKVEYTIAESGEISNCRVVEAVPLDSFGDAACKAATRAYFYPMEESEIAGEIKNYKSKVEFKLAQ